MRKDKLGLIRQLKIALIIESYNPIVEWFKELWSKLCVIQCDVYHNKGGEFIFYIINDDFYNYVFYRDIKKDELWCSSNEYWDILEHKFGFSYEEIQKVTEFLINSSCINSKMSFSQVNVDLNNFKSNYVFRVSMNTRINTRINTNLNSAYSISSDNRI